MRIVIIINYCNNFQHSRNKQNAVRLKIIPCISLIMCKCKLVPETVAEKVKNHIDMTDQSKLIDSCMLFQHENEVFILHKGESATYVVRAVAS